MDEQDEDGLTALHWAVENDSLAAVELLLAAGADPSVAISDVRSWLHELQPLHLAAWIGPPDDVPIIKALLAAGTAPDARVGGRGDYVGYTPVHFAAHMGNAAALTVLLDAGVPVDCLGDPRFASYETPLCAACGSWMRNIEEVQLLLQRGAAVNPGPQLAIPLHEAASRGNAGVMNLLLAAGADPNAADEDGNTAMHRAARALRPAPVRLIAAWGADPLRTNTQGQRPLQRVNRWGQERLNTIAALVAAGDRDWALVPRPCPGLELAGGRVARRPKRAAPAGGEAGGGGAGACAHCAAGAAPGHAAAAAAGDADGGARV